jgi:signal transduction histidine kinase
VPEKSSNALRNERVICNIVLFSTYLIIAIIIVLLLVSFAIGTATHTPGKLLVGGCALLYIVFTNVLLRLSYKRIVEYMLVAFYLVLASGVVWCWGINIPIGALMFALAIILAGILLNARHALVAALASSIILACLQLTIELHGYSPVFQWTENQSSFGDVLAYSTVFGMMALTSWLYNREMERSLAQAQHARSALQVQKATLKAAVKKRTAQLHQAQLKEAQQMYRFAELGQMGVTLLHDLANHLTALSLEIDGLQNTEHSKAASRAQRITHYLGDMIHKTRDRLNGGTDKHTFNIIRTVSELIDFMNDKAERANVAIEWQPPAQSWQYTGDAASLSQVIAIIVNNAIDSYSVSVSPRRIVNVTLVRDKTHITIRVSDTGQEITKSRRKLLFKPFRSSKKSGMGLGLFIARQIVEMQFSGTLILNPKSAQTEFVITLPYKHGK